VSAVVSAPKKTASRVKARLKGRSEPFVFCPNDGFFFRPIYTDGKCPLCGEEVVDESPPLPLLLRYDRFRFGMGVLAFVSIAMSTLVLVMYFTR
jgi:hypothetical protein